MFGEHQWANAECVREYKKSLPESTVESTVESRDHCEDYSRAFQNIRLIDFASCASMTNGRR